MSERHFIRNTFVLGAVGVLAVAGFKAVENNECVRAVMDRDFLGALGCISEGDAGASGEIGGIKLKTEDLVDGSLTMSFGTLSMQIAGTGTARYNGDWFKNLPGVNDLERYYNKDNAKTTEVLANPCTRFDGNYETAFDPNVTPADDGKSVVKYVIDMSPDGTRIDELRIDAGILDLCAPRIALTKANESLWTERNWQAGSFGNKEWNAFTYAMKKSIVNGALAQSCAEDVLNMDAVVTNIETYARGELSTSPAEAALVADAFTIDPATGQDRVTTTIAPPTDRQAYYQAQAEKERQSFIDGSAFDKGLEIDLEIEQIGIRGCTYTGTAAGATP